MNPTARDPLTLQQQADDILHSFDPVHQCGDRCAHLQRTHRIERRRPGAVAPESGSAPTLDPETEAARGADDARAA